MCYKNYRIEFARLVTKNYDYNIQDIQLVKDNTPTKRKILKLFLLFLYRPICDI